MRRLALFLPNLQGGAAERAMAHLARGLADQGLWRVRSGNT